MKRAPGLIIFLIILLSLGGCTFLIADYEDESKQSHKDPESAELDEIDDGENIIPAPPIDLVFYEIKGTSDHLKVSTRERMEQWRHNIVKLAKGHPDLIIINGQKKENLVALTFDDGPDRRVTPQVIAILNEYNVVGNFFFLGENANALPHIVKEAYDSGHQIYAHSFSHSNYTNKSYDYIYRDFQKTNQVLEDITGLKPLLMRPPYGIVTDHVIKAAQNHEQKIIIWSTDTLDWSQRERDNIVKNVLENVRPGEIILMHSIGNNQATVEALPAIIENIQHRGFRIVGLDKLLH